MRILLCLSVALVAAVAVSTRAEAQNYPWCAYYGGGMDDGGGTNCGFTTFQQCLDTVKSEIPNTFLHLDRIPGLECGAGIKTSVA